MDDLFQRNTMTLDQYIEALVALRKARPDLASARVQKWSAARGRHDAPEPKIGYGKVKVVGGTKSEIKQFWQEGYDPLEEKGPEVIRI